MNMYYICAIKFAIILSCLQCINGTDEHLPRRSVYNNISVSMDEESYTEPSLSAVTFDNHLHPIGPIPDVSPECHELLTLLGESAANFTVCTLKNARPITICRSCMNAFQVVSDIYKNISDENQNDCQNELLNRDRLMIVQSTYQYISSLWSNAQCARCYDSTDNTTPCNDTIVFFQKLKDVVMCLNKTELFNNFEGTIIDGGEKDVCRECDKVYIELNAFYDNLNTKYNNDLCMDIVDSMNITRHEWSSKFNCLQFFFKGLFVYIISSCIALLTILFYVANRFTTNVRESELVLQKRMSFVQSHTESIQR